MNASASKPLAFDTARFETVSIEVKPRKVRQAKPRIYFDGATVPVSLYTRPDYGIGTDDDASIIERLSRLAALHAPENIWQPGQIELPKLRRTVVRKPRDVRVVLSYPYVAKPRDEHSDLLAVNALVPQMPGREDVCQEIMLALWQQKITLDRIKANRADLRAFIRSFNRENYEAGGYAISLDEPMISGQSWHDHLSDEHSLGARS